MENTPPQPPNRRAVFHSLVLGGLLPIAAFAIVEQFYGTIGGLIAGIVFGVGEILFELIRDRKVQGITIIGNALVIGLGAISLFENDSRLFKLQPAIILFVLAGLMIGSSLFKRPFLAELSKKQMPNAPDHVRERLASMNWRAGLCLAFIGLLSVHAALYWSTAAWAFLKGVGAPLILGAYLGAEILVIRLRNRK